MPFPFAPAAALLGAGLNFLTDSQNSNKMAEMSKYNTDATIAAQKEMADKAYSRNLEQWNRENAYNSPTEQMLRLKRAGMNPMLLAGSGSIGANSAARGQAAPTYNPSYNYQAAMTPKIDTMGLMSSVQDLAMGKAQINKVKEETAILREEKTIRAVEALTAVMSEKNVPSIVEATLRKLLADATLSESSASLASGSLKYDLDYRKSLSAEKATSARRASKELEEFFPVDVKSKELQRELLEMQRDTGKIDLDMLKKLGIDQKANTWLKIFGRKAPGLFEYFMKP